MSAGDVTPPARRAALALHAMGEADRRWMLPRLSAAQRAMLSPLLAELTELGLPPQAAVLADLQRAPGVPPVAAVPVWNAALLPALLTEPDRLLGQLLAIEGWSGRQALRRALGHARAPNVAQVHAAASPPVALRRSLLEAVHAMALEHPVPVGREGMGAWIRQRLARGRPT